MRWMKNIKRDGQKEIKREEDTDGISSFEARAGS